ncbi:MAG: NDP-hexose 2,3-dehydratase family protein [Nitrospirae bacterium]|nr:NDP-hexose 2,3-dehydratase family protein [Nitrospirota bacterium]
MTDAAGDKLKAALNGPAGASAAGIQGESLRHICFSSETEEDLHLSRSTRYAVNSDRAVDLWIEGHRHRTRLQTEILPLAEISGWRTNPETGNISHDTGRFFSVTGVYARHRRGDEEIAWDQPIIDQAEVGILGIAAKKINNLMHFCLQAKEEPGNINQIQISPTVQATYSNYRQVHGGQLPPFLEMFMDPAAGRILFSRLQTEDGGRFLFKVNRNMIVMAGDAEMEALPERFIWLTLRQISALIKRDNMVNACARSVLSCLI